MRNEINGMSQTELAEVKEPTGRVWSLSLGYGHCHSCDCKGYISKHNGTHECKTCGHHYDRHN